MTEQALSMTEPKQKLMKLEKFVPNPTELTGRFGRFLAEYLGGDHEILPQGFVMGCELAIHDLQTGVNGITGEYIQNKLVGYPPQIYALLRMEVPRIAEAVFPADFAEEAKKFIKEVNESASE